MATKALDLVDSAIPSTMSEYQTLKKSVELRDEIALQLDVKQNRIWSELTCRKRQFDLEWLTRDGMQEVTFCHEATTNGRVTEPATSINQFNPAQDMRNYTLKGVNNSQIWTQVAFKNVTEFLEGPA